LWLGICTVADVPGVRSPEDLDVWQLAWELKERVFAFTAVLPASRDFNFCDQIRAAARSVTDNLSEGFYRFTPRDNARFVNMAKGSVGEVRNQLREARARDYLSSADYETLDLLCRRALGASTRFHAYLRSLPKDFNPGDKSSRT